MSTYGKFYTESLYPIQDGVIRVMRDIRTPFYLTGGTALSRGYYNHRFSDDLDFFVNDSADFKDLVTAALDAISAKYRVTSDVEAHDYFQIHVHVDDTSLKIDMVNDVAAHEGDIDEHPSLGRIDNVNNMLSNKLSALYRYEGKDVVDILEICRYTDFNWNDIIAQARKKEAGLEPSIASEIIKNIPDENLRSIKWVARPDYAAMRKDLEQIAWDILEGGGNRVKGVK